MTVPWSTVPASALATSGGHGRPPSVCVHDERGRLTPEFISLLSQRLRELGGPRPDGGGLRQDHAVRWLTAAMVSLAVLAGGSAVVS